MPAPDWSSPLGLSVALFVFYGAFNVLIGALAPLMMERPGGRGMLILSPRTDRELFGRPIDEIRARSPEVVVLRVALITWLAGTLVAVGVFEAAVAWFGLAGGATWAYWTLILVDLGMVPFWLAFLRPWLRAGVRIGLADLPPVWWVPSVAFVPAAVLGFVALY